MNIWTMAGGYIAAGVLFWLFIGAKEDLATQVEYCNTTKLAAVVQAEKLVRQATESAYSERIAQLEAMALDGQKAVDRANTAKMEAIVASNEQSITINQLMRDADVDEIPDSEECLNVFVPSGAVDGMRMRPRACPNSGIGRDRNRQICANTRGTDETDLPYGDFAEITFGDGLVLWEIDRGTIRTQNAQLEAIRTLNVSE